MSENSSEILNASIEVKKLSNFLEPISVLVDECKIEILDDKLRIRAVDEANVCMCHSELSKDSFDSYESKESTVGVDLERLEDTIGMGESSSTVDLVVDSSDQKLNISVENFEYNLSLIDTNSIRDSTEIPDIDLSSKAEISGKQLSRGVEAADMVSDRVSLRFSKENDNFQVGAEGDTDDVTVEYNEDDLESISINDDSALYSLNYLKNISNILGSSESVSLSLGDDNPVEIKYEDDDGNLSVIYMLAPRINS